MRAGGSRRWLEGSVRRLAFPRREDGGGLPALVFLTPMLIIFGVFSWGPIIADRS